MVSELGAGGGGYQKIGARVSLREASTKPESTKCFALIFEFSQKFAIEIGSTACVDFFPFTFQWCVRTCHPISALASLSPLQRSQPVPVAFLAYESHRTSSALSGTSSLGRYLLFGHSWFSLPGFDQRSKSYLCTFPSHFS